jgi:hypothetical protein
MWSYQDAATYPNDADTGELGDDNRSLRFSHGGNNTSPAMMPMKAESGRGGARLGASLLQTMSKGL